jgi:hypothetical protein
MRRGQVVQKHISNALDAAFSRNGVPYDHPMRDELDAGAELSLDGKNIRVPDGRGHSVPVDERIIALKRERYSHEFPPEPPAPPPLRIARNDMAKLSENLDKLAKGTAVAE